ncbi:hypothetical protein A9Q96_05680 [Rhodobacterales bacterium 52_120_T64]|nr:hypothetical protein A9Q96_05680 [Rhodobacterales bacterium 52_120_T64]
MRNKPTQNVITANDLLSGEVVYLMASGKWSPEHGSAILFDHDEAANDRLAQVEGSDSSIVGPYLAGATQTHNQGPSPVHFREIFRTKGPSNRSLGKQVRSA